MNMKVPKSSGFKITITGAMVAYAIFWGGSVNAKIEQLQGVYQFMQDISTRLSRIEGALGVKKDSDNLSDK